jgi:hypothetical protein
LQHLLKRVPYDFRQLRAALARVMDETPPNGYRNQQYKDSVIWEAVIELSNTYAVYFVTEDKDFFENKEPKTGVATNLRAECKREGRNISVYYGLESYLESIRGEVPPLDYAALATAVERVVIDALLGLASEQVFELHELIDSRISAFLIEKVDTLALNFELDHRATVMQPKTAWISRIHNQRDSVSLDGAVHRSTSPSTR